MNTKLGQHAIICLERTVWNHRMMAFNEFITWKKGNYSFTALALIVVNMGILNLKRNFN